MTNKTSIFLRAAAFCILHSAFCISSASAVTITASATAVGAGDPTPVQATISDGTVEHLYLVYQISGSSYAWNTNEMTSVSATVYAGSIPPLSGAVTVEWYVTDGTSSSAPTTTTLAALPDYNRYHDGAEYNASAAPCGWRQVEGTNWVADAPNHSQWKASGVNIAKQNVAGAIYSDSTIGIDFPIMYFYNLPPSENANIRSPKLTGGVGTIDFRTKLVGTILTSELTVQVARTIDEPTEADWEDLPEGKGKFAYSGQNVTRIIHLVLNDYSVTYVRIVRTGNNIFNSSLTSGRFSIDNICITKPPADVGIIEKLKNPGYPAADQNILMRCAVTNCVEETPAINRRVSVKYQYVARDTYAPIASAYAWSSAEMAYMGKDNNGLDWYEGTIPTQKVGYVWYYYQVDYDGYHYGENPLTGASESISPAYWDAGADTHDCPTAGTKFQVRPYRSRYARIAIEAQTQDLSIPEMSLVDNEQWQAVIPVNGVTVISNYFLGFGYYEDDAEAYATEPVVWGENNPDALSDPTLAGFLESSQDTTVTNQLVALNEKDYRGFYLYRFSSNFKKEEGAAQIDEDSRRYDYIVKKAVYQDFDDWTASPDYYESSLGGLPTLTFTENFDGNAASAASGSICITNAWYEDQYFSTDYKEENFQDEDLSDEYSARPLITERQFLRKGSRILADRKAKNTDASVNMTLALNLNGSVENTSGSLPYGLEKISFKARASVDDSNFAMYRNGTAWQLPSNGNAIFVNAKWQLSQMAPSKPYLSYIFLYQPADQFGDYGASWYEVRIIQNDSADANNNTVRVELWRKDSTASAAVFVSGTAASAKYSLAVERNVNVRAYNESNKFCAQVSFTGNTSYQATVKETTARSALLTKGGTIGFGVFDAVPVIKEVKAGAANGGSELLNSLSGTWQNWSHGGQRPDDQPRWTITSDTITRTVPTQTIGIYAANCVGGEDQAKTSELPSTPNATVTVNTFDMKEFTVPFKAWNKKFVQIIYDDGDGGIVLDDIKYDPWRAITRYYGDDAKSEIGNTRYRDWTSIDDQDNWLERPLGTTGESMKQNWAVLEGWTVKSGAFQVGANFDRSRANTNFVQGIVSPELENGIGSCSFSYAASGGKVVYGVEHTDHRNYRQWIPDAVYTNAAGASGERYTKIGVNYGGDSKGGRIRVRLYGPQDVVDLLDKNPDCGYDPAWGGSDDNACLLIDNLRVKDYPEDENDNAWNAYNLLVTGDAPDGQIYNNSGKSCFFNNSPTNGVYGAEEFNDNDPYLESPPLSGVGVGEIAFQYRIVDNTGDGDGHLFIKVAPRRDTPVAEWKTITNLVVSANGQAFVKFDNDKIFDERNFVVRFYNSKQPGTPRIVIDNVLVTAPARPSFEFEYVRLLPVQPLAGTNTVVEAKIMREIMNPQNVKIYVSYHKFDLNNGHEAWGVTNWFDPLTSPKVELLLVGDKVYRTQDRSGNPTGIPAFDANDLVEFVVWGTHAAIDLNGGDTAIIQGNETFELPEWYRTLDLNERVIVPMDMNADRVAEGWSPYFWVFSCPPGTFFVNEINNWFSSSQNIDDHGTAEYIEFVGPAGTDLGGWKLMVIENGTDCEDLEYTIPPNTRLPSDIETGWGFYMWADFWARTRSVADGGPIRVDVDFPDSADPEDRNLGNYGGILVFRPNGIIEQTVRFGNTPTGVFTDQDFWIWTGRKNSNKADKSLSLVSNVIEGEESTTLVAGSVVTDFKWTSEVVSQSPVAANGTDQVFADLGGSVVVALHYPDGTEITDEDVLAWIAHYGAEQSDIDALGTNDKVDEEFLLNLDLTKACVAELKITSIRIEDGAVYLNVELTRTEDGTPVGTRKINGTLKLLGTADLVNGTFTALPAADIGNADFSRNNLSGIEYELPASNPPAFFKVIIE